MASLLHIDVFVTTNKARPYFELLTVTALKHMGFNPIMIEKPMLERYWECERLATSDIYLVLDDDVLPSTEKTLEQLVQILRDHPDYSQLGLGWKANMNDEENNSWILHKGRLIWEMYAVGGILAIRKGTIEDIGIEPEFKSGYGDDRVLGQTARIQGYKVGIVPNLWFHHLGAKETTFKYI